SSWTSLTPRPISRLTEYTVRSGCVISISRASAPAITSPDSVTDTTLGTIPERIRGPVRSITATRLLVVPRSMPTMRGLAWPKSICRVDIQFLFDVAQQVRHVLSAIQHRANLVEHGLVRLFVITCEETGQACIRFAEHAREPLLRRYKLLAR